MSVATAIVHHWDMNCSIKVNKSIFLLLYRLNFRIPSTGKAICGHLRHCSPELTIPLLGEASPKRASTPPPLPLPGPTKTACESHRSHTRQEQIIIRKIYYHDRDKLGSYTFKAFLP